MPTERDSSFAKLNDNTGSVILKYWPIILGCLFAALSVGGIYVKLDYIAKSQDKAESQFIAINDRQNLAGNSIIEIRSQIDRLNQEVKRNESDLSELRRRLDVLTEKQRWSPK